jgi:hypothetical protein
MNRPIPQGFFAISAAMSRPRGRLARVSGGKIMFRAAAILCGSMVVLGIGMVIGAGIAQSLPLSTLISGKLAAIAPELLAINGLASP